MYCTNSLIYSNSTLCPHCIYMFCINLITNSDLCHLCRWQKRHNAARNSIITRGTYIVYNLLITRNDILCSSSKNIGVQLVKCLGRVLLHINILSTHWANSLILDTPFWGAPFGFPTPFASAHVVVFGLDPGEGGRWSGGDWPRLPVWWLRCDPVTYTTTAASYSTSTSWY